MQRRLMTVDLRLPGERSSLRARGAAEDDDISQRIAAEAVGAMDTTG